MQGAHTVKDESSYSHDSKYPSKQQQHHSTVFTLNSNTIICHVPWYRLITILYKDLMLDILHTVWLLILILANHTGVERAGVEPSSSLVNDSMLQTYFLWIVGIYPLNPALFLFNEFMFMCLCFME